MGYRGVAEATAVEVGPVLVPREGLPPRDVAGSRGRCGGSGRPRDGQLREDEWWSSERQLGGSTRRQYRQQFWSWRWWCRSSALGEAECAAVHFHAEPSLRHAARGHLPTQFVLILISF